MPEMGWNWSILLVLLSLDIPCFVSKVQTILGPNWFCMVCAKLVSLGSLANLAIFYITQFLI